MNMNQILPNLQKIIFAILDALNIDRKNKSMKGGKNRSGNILLELCRGNNLFIVNGRIGDDYVES